MIGKNIKEYRKRRGLSLSEFSERSGISKSYISNIERNLHQNPSIQIMNKIASVLNVELEDLLIPGSSIKSESVVENEWLDFIQELKNSGIEKKHIQEYKTVIEFINWKNRNLDSSK
jgi:XRE family transcriptional regulator, master regulator for biofilm formation